MEIILENIFKIIVKIYSGEGIGLNLKGKWM